MRFIAKKDTKFNMEETTNVSKNIVYKRPPFYKRVFANFIDFFSFVVLFVFIFVGIRSIVSSTPYYQQADKEISRIKTQSALYIKISETGYLMDVVTYWNRQDDSMGHKKFNLYFAIENFLSFCENECDKKDYDEILLSYNEYRLSDTLKHEGIPYFILNNENEIIENNECKANAASYYRVYASYIDEYAQGYLITKIPGYYDYQKFQSDMFLYVELLISYPLAALIVYLVPPLIFKRGRKTIGKLIYKIGLVNDKNCLNVSTGKIIARQAIVVFAELVLGAVTLCVPIIISFSMMAFSKKKQSFPDYMLGVTEIDTSYDKIYYNKEEILLEQLSKENGAINFQMKKDNF